MFTRRAIVLAAVLAVLSTAILSSSANVKDEHSLLFRAYNLTVSAARYAFVGVVGTDGLWRGEAETISSEDLSIWNAPTIPWSVGDEAVGGEADRTRPVVLVEHHERCAGCGPLRTAFYEIEVYSSVREFDFEMRVISDETPKEALEGCEWRVSVFEPAQKRWREVARERDQLPAHKLAPKLIEAMDAARE